MSLLLHEEHEKLVTDLMDQSNRAEYKRECDVFSPGIVVRLLGALLVGSGNLIYGKKPSYEKFKAIEVIARIPYQSWEAVTYVFLTMFYTSEKRAVALTRTSRFSRLAQDNETMHVIVISQLLQGNHRNHFFRHTVVPFIFSFFYFIISYIMYFISPRSAYELNYIFEDHAYQQYSKFLELYKADLKARPIVSTYLDFYGRSHDSEYDFFCAVRNDELIHRNQSYFKACEHA